MSKEKVIITLIFMVLTVPLYAADINLEEKSNKNMEMRHIEDLKRIQSAFSESSEKDNTVIYEYDKYSTYKIRARTAMDTYIYLPEGEVINFYKFGEEANFRFTPLKDQNDVNTNIGFIEVRYAGADTNLTIIGESGNFYNFYVRVDDHKSPYLPHHKVFIEDQHFSEKILSLKIPYKKIEDIGIAGKPDESVKGEKIEVKRVIAKTDEEIGDYLRQIDNTPMNQLHRNQNLDLRYTIYLRKNLIAPMAVFDDGYWTYFKLSTGKNLDKLQDFPVLFEVKDGIEQPVNTKVINNYLIALNISDVWALRVGERFICIEKDIYDEEIILKLKK